MAAIFHGQIKKSQACAKCKAQKKELLGCTKCAVGPGIYNQSYCSIACQKADFHDHNPKCEAVQQQIAIRRTNSPGKQKDIEDLMIFHRKHAVGLVAACVSAMDLVNHRENAGISPFALLLERNAPGQDKHSQFKVKDAAANISFATVFGQFLSENMEAVRPCVESINKEPLRVNLRIQNGTTGGLVSTFLNITTTEINLLKQAGAPYKNWRAILDWDLSDPKTRGIMPAPVLLNEQQTIASATDSKYCHSCKADTNFDAKMCSGCRSAYYCNVECQKKAWKSHKVQCKSAKPWIDQPLYDAVVKHMISIDASMPYRLSVIQCHRQAKNASDGIVIETKVSGTKSNPRFSLLDAYTQDLETIFETYKEDARKIYEANRLPARNADQYIIMFVIQIFKDESGAIVNIHFSPVIALKTHFTEIPDNPRWKQVMGNAIAAAR